MHYLASYRNLINKKEAMKTKFATGEFKIKTLSKENGSFTFVASGFKKDRYQEKIKPDGWVFAPFKKNPVMLWGHDHSIPAIANVTKIWKEGNKILAKAVWASTTFAQEIRTLVEEGFLHAVSVGFMPLEREGEYPEYVYTKQELLEISVVNVPAYADALITQAKSMGLKEVVKHIKKPKETNLISLNKKVKTLTEKVDKLLALQEEKKVGTSKKAKKVKDTERALQIADKAIEIGLLNLRKKKI